LRRLPEQVAVAREGYRPLCGVGSSAHRDPEPMSLFLRSLFFTVLFPGTVTVILPWAIVTRWWPAEFPGWGAAQAAALVPIGLGAAVLLHSVWTFAAVGRGTLVPVDAPRRLVVVGLYRYVRNPMYVGVAAILLGEALMFRSRALLGYTAVWFAVVNLFILLYEEPHLGRRFGDSYARYRRAVGRWLPGRRYDSP